mmetsp:Transcript_70898/g.129729  ORF Transcript_70898/g.129729 Transcript_70898/m.129729 type:complete len:402 (-) Transcript_70898:68-1273(-)
MAEAEAPKTVKGKKGKGPPPPGAGAPPPPYAAAAPVGKGPPPPGGERPGKGPPAPGAGNWMSPAEVKMRATIEWLLALDAKEREQMEQAETFQFTLENPAPPLKATGERPGPAAAEDEAMTLSSMKSFEAAADDGYAGAAAAAAKAETSEALPVAPASPPATIQCTLDMGTVNAAELLCRQGFRPAVMNFAHGYNCGGGFEHAGGSQEEDIFRKTSVFLSLWPHRRVDDGPGVLARGMWIGDFDEQLDRKEAFYPHTECGGIYSPHVRLVCELDIRDTPLTRKDVSSLPTIGVLTVAAQDCGREPPFRPELLYEKLRTALWLAVQGKHDAVVLGAFGCGYFRNPPDVVAETCRGLLQGEFAGAFRAVVFAIPGRFSGNYRSFAELFEERDPRAADCLKPKS